MDTDGSTDEEQISRRFSFDYGAHRLGSDPTSQKRDVVHPAPVNTGILRCAQNDKWGMDWGDAGHPAKADSSAALRNDRQKDRQRQGRNTEILSQKRLRMTAEVECWRGLILAF